MWGIWIREGLQNPFLLHRQMYVLIIGQESLPRLLNDKFLQPLKRGCQKLKHCQRTPTGHPLATTISSISVSKCLFPPKCLSLRFCQYDQFTELGSTWKRLIERNISTRPLLNLFPLRESSGLSRVQKVHELVPAQCNVYTQNQITKPYQGMQGPNDNNG